MAQIADRKRDPNFILVGRKRGINLVGAPVKLSDVNIKFEKMHGKLNSTDAKIDLSHCFDAFPNQRVRSSVGMKLSFQLLCNLGLFTHPSAMLCFIVHAVMHKYT